MPTPFLRTLVGKPVLLLVFSYLPLNMLSFIVECFVHLPNVCLAVPIFVCAVDLQTCPSGGICTLYLVLSSSPNSKFLCIAVYLMFSP